MEQRGEALGGGLVNMTGTALLAGALLWKGAGLAGEMFGEGGGLPVEGEAPAGGAAAAEPRVGISIKGEALEGYADTQPACFVAGTQVVTLVDPKHPHRLVTKNIEDVHVGDYVLTRSQSDEHAPLERRRVVQIFVHTVYSLQLVTVRARGHEEQIRTTSEHPFWVEGRGWTRAGSLTAGMRVEEPDGSAAYVVSSAAEAHPEGVKAYNFEVEGDHTYFVEAAKNDREPVWVHNTCDLTGADGEPIAGTAARRAMEDDLLQQQGMREIAPPSNRGMQNPIVREAAENGDIEHALLQEQRVRHSRRALSVDISAAAFPVALPAVVLAEP